MKRILLLATLALSTFALHAQSNDFGMWNTFSINKDIGKKLTLGIDQELRLRENASTINLIYTNIGASYKATDFFKVSLVYRFIDKHKEDYTWGIRHRVFVDLSFKVKPGKFSLGYRARFQAEWRGLNYSNDFGRIPEVFMRNQVKIAYKASDKVEPYIGTEVRWQIQNPRIPYHNSIDRGRYFAGVNYEINHDNTIGTYFLVQKETNVNDRQSLYILGLEYTLNL